MNGINVVYQCSDLYSKIAGVSMFSLLDNSKDIDLLQIYIIDVGISCENKRRLRELAEVFGRKLIFVDAQEKIEKFKGKGLKPYHGSYGMYLKFFLDEMIDCEERALYLDCDTIINRSIKELVNIELDGKAMAMSADCMNSHMKSGLGLPEEKVYYNTGVILFDLQRWKNDCKDIFLQFVENNTNEYIYAEQDMINVCLNDEILKIGNTYNCISLYEQFSYDEVCKIYNLNEENFYTKKQFDRDVLNPTIIHFPTVVLSRPWYDDCISGWTSKFDKYYYNEINPWRNVSKSTSNLALSTRMQKILFVHCPRKIYVFVHHLVSNMYTKKINRRYSKKYE